MKLKKTWNILNVVKNYKKKDIIKNLNKSTGLSSNFSKKLINDLIDLIIQNIKKGNLNLKNLGSFKIIYKKQRLGRNPKTKDPFIISARKSIKFTVSKKILNNLSKTV